MVGAIVLQYLSVRSTSEREKKMDMYLLMLTHILFSSDHIEVERFKKYKQRMISHFVQLRLAM